MASSSEVNITMIDALCPSCNKVKSLEACFHCMQPLCSECVNNHVEAWKDNTVKYFDTVNKKIDKYLEKINTLNPLISQNKTNAEKVKNEIEESFQNFIKKLTSQKEELFKKIDQIEQENQELKTFESDILTLKENLNEFQQRVKDSRENKTDKNQTPAEFKFYQECKEKIIKVSASYTSIKKNPIKIIGEYEKPQIAEFDLNFFGNLIINESEVLKPNNDGFIFNKKEKAKHVKSDYKSVESKEKNGEKTDKIHMFGTLRVKLKRLAEQMNELQGTVKNPTVEFDLKINPKYIANNSKYIFIADEEGNLCIYELNSSLIEKASIKLMITNLKGLSANKKYLAVSFTDLTQDQINTITKTTKKFDSKSGVCLFKLNDLQNLSFEKVFTTTKNYSLLSPSGIAINESYLFACDRDLHALYKIDLKNGNLLQRLITTDQEPTSISLGEKYFVFTDALKLELNLVDMDKLNILKTVKFSEDLFNQPFDVTLKDNNYIFVKNKADTRIILYDSNLSIKYSFEYDNSSGLGINFIKAKSDFLIVGYSSSDNKSYKLGLFSDF